MLKTADVLDARRLSAPMPTGTASEGLRRIVATTALATGVIVGMMLFQSNVAQAQSVWVGTTADYGTVTNWNPNTVATGGVAGIFDNTVGAGSTIVDLGAAVFTPSTWTINGSTAFTFQNGTANFTAGGLTNNSSATQTISVILGGAGAGVTQAGTGTLILSGANTYGGATTITAGTLQLGAAGVIPDGSAVIINGGTLNLNNFTETIGSLSGAGGTIATGGATGRLNVNQAGPGTYAGGFSGATGSAVVYLEKQGAGTLTLSGTNTTTGAGAVIVSAGTLALQGGNAIGDNNFLQVNAGAIADLQANETIGTVLGPVGGTIALNGNTLTLVGPGAPGGGNAFLTITGTGGLTINGAGFSQGFTQPLSYTGATTILNGRLELGGNNIIANGSTVVINGASAILDIQSFTDTVAGVSLQAGSIAGTTGVLTSLTDIDAQSGSVSAILGGAAGLTKTTAGTVMLSGANTYTGATTINAGTLAGGAANVFSAASATTINTGGTLDLGGFAQTINAVSLAGGTLTNGTLTGAVTSTGGTINAIAGTATVTTTAGLTTATGANTYTGATTINGGELRVNGSLGNTAVAVNNTGTLSGIGTIGGAVTVNNGGTLSAGQSPGTLTVGSLTLNAGSNSVFELNTPGTVGGVTNDLVISNGPVQLGGTLTATAASAGFYRLINVVGGGAITGNFTTVTVAGFTGQVYTNAPGAAEQVNLSVLGVGQVMQFWDGADTLGNGTVDGGAGTWNAANTNWTGVPGQAGVNAAWLSSVGVFQGTAGVITVAGTQAFDTLQFNVDGYVLNGGQLGIGVAGGGTINVNGAGLTTTINSAIVDGAGTSLTKVGAGTLNLGGVNTYTGGTTVSAGTLGLLAGGVLASNVTVDAAGTFNNAGTVNASVINNGTTSNSNLIVGSVTNTGTLTTTGTIQGGVTNSGTVNAAGVVNGAIANNAGTFTVIGALAGNAAFTNASGATLNVTGGSFTGLTSVSNAGTVNLGGGFTLSAPTILNSGSFASAGTINAATLFSNTGAVNASGAINTAELRNTGTFTLTGALGGTVTALNNNGGTLTIGSASFSGIGTLTNSGLVQIGAGSLSAATIANLGTFNSAGAVTATTAFNNSGTANLSGTVTTPVLNNSGTLNVVGGDLTSNAPLINSGTVALTAGRSLSVGSFNNAGTLNLQNNVANNAVNIGGAYTGNGNVLLDVDIGGSRADRITINGGGSSGTGVVAINQVLQGGGGIGVSQNDILVVSGASGVKFTAANAVASSTPSPFAGGGGQLLSTSNSIVQYWFGETAPNSGTYVVRPDLNVTAASSFVASVSSALSSINAYSEPASAFISGPSDPAPNTLSFGSWGRARGGRLDTDSTSRVNSPGGVSRSFDMTNRTDFNGFQLGLDMGLYNINGTGWTTNIGLHGGKVEAQVRATGVALDLEQPFYGAYAAVRNSSGFAFDVLFRRDQFDMKLTSQAANLSKEKLKADGYSGLASLSQRFNITDTIYIDPSVAILYSRAEVDRLRVGADSSVAWQPIESITGRVGVQIGTFFQPTSEIIVSPYVALSAWREFSGKTEAVGSFATVSFPTTTNRIGTYGQASLGAAISSVTPGLSGFVRGDIRFGDRVEGFAFNGGLRYQF
ncbi:autotransporter-associated beta strand protein [Bosea sp. BE125]|uniref:autotransporter-associated beta strand repeat-containing protein n=1 Tax=Bosea sp. BE125 TaxID=2817909 RepID=UPI00285D9046|nr:autotransporter-associated beta strand repeat-containing protein [Bosea sp. BE125]MDR6873430.1 autotransporter-associated beta strand protein [Bosea sp. BE125]